MKSLHSVKPVGELRCTDDDSLYPFIGFQLLDTVSDKQRSQRPALTMGMKNIPADRPNAAVFSEIDPPASNDLIAYFHHVVIFDFFIEITNQISFFFRSKVFRRVELEQL